MDLVDQSLERRLVVLCTQRKILRGWSVLRSLSEFCFGLRRLEANLR